MSELASFEAGSGIFAVLGAIGGGLLVKLADRLITSSDHKLEDSADVRRELWERVEALEQRTIVMQRDLDEWKTKYYELLAEHHQLKAENHSIREENHKLLSSLAAMKLQIQQLQRKFPADFTTTPGPTDDISGQTRE